MKKLTKQDILSIQLRYEAGATQQHIASIFGIDQSHVSRLINKKTEKPITQYNIELSKLLDSKRILTANLNVLNDTINNMIKESK